MNRREIKTVAIQCTRGLDYDSAMRAVVKLTAPELKPEKAAAIVKNLKIFQAMYNCYRSERFRTYANRTTESA